MNTSTSTSTSTSTFINGSGTPTSYRPQKAKSHGDAWLAVWDSIVQRIPSWVPGLLILTALVGQTYLALKRGGTSALEMDIAGVLFFLTALFYRGPLRLWWYLFAPLSALCLVLPIGYLEAARGAGFAVLVRASLLPVLSLVAGTLLVVSRDTQSKASDAKKELDRLALRNRELLKKMKVMEHEMKSLTNLIHDVTEPKAKKAVGGLEFGQEASGIGSVEMETVEIKAGYEGGRGIEIPVLGISELQSVLQTELETVRASVPSELQARFVLTAPVEISIPMAVHGERETLRAVVRACLERAVDSLGGGAGVIRVGLRLGLYSITIAIEDNGRGLSEALQNKLEARGLSVTGASLGIAQVREVMERMGARCEISSRLGVGSRVVMELPRVDAFVSASSPDAPRGIRGRKNEISLSSNQGSQRA